MMFVLSVKMNRKKMLGVLCIAIAAILFTVLLRNGLSGELAAGGKPGGIFSKGIKSLSGKTNEERTEFLTSFGWQVSEEPIEISEVVIPAEFDEIMENYNALQKKQGYNLEKYRGKRVRRYTYEIENYPTDDKTLQIRANLLICEEKIIGGDICSTALDGFMHGFELPKEEKAA